MRARILRDNPRPDNSWLDSREFTAAIKAAGITGTWSPRELRHPFVSLMSDSGVPVEEIPPRRPRHHPHHRVYRHQLRPVLEKGA